MLFIIIIAFAILGFAVSSRLKSKFKKYSKIPLASGMSGAEAAAMMLRDHGLHDVKIMSVGGRLTDHYNPADKTVNLSEAVYYGRNAAAVAVAAHECGHAVQHAEAYSMLQVRSTLVPLQNVSAKVLNMIFMLSIFGLAFFAIPYDWVMLAIIACYGVIALFSLVTLPVEFDASKRATDWIYASRIVNNQELAMSKDALNWAAMTYVVSALSSLVMLAYFVLSYLGND